MDELQQLLVRNAALSTELRLVKERLAETNTANLYLLTRLSIIDQPASSSSGNLSRPYIENGSNMMGNSMLTSKDSADLLDLMDGDLQDEKIAQWADEVSKPPHREIGVGISKGTEHMEERGLGEERIGFTVTNNDGSTTFIPTSSVENSTSSAEGSTSSTENSTSSTENSTPRVPKAPLRFHDREHNRLSGAATFIEEKTEDEQDDHWTWYAQQFPRHTAEEYKVYYEENIRPGYIKKKINESIITTRESSSEDDDGKNVRPEYIKKNSSESITTTDESSLESDQGENAQPEYIRNKADELVTTTPESSPKDDHEENVRQEDAKKEGNESTTTTPESSSEGDHEENIRQEDIKQESNESTTTTPESRSENVTPVADDVSTPPDDPSVSTSAMSPNTFKKPRFHRSRPRNVVYPRSVDDIFARGEQQAFQTVLISNIPANIQPTEVLSTLRDWNVLSITPLKTAGMKTNPHTETNAALIVFLDPSQARDYVAYRHTNFLFFDSDQSDVPFKATVKLLDKPSRPLRDEQAGPSSSRGPGSPAVKPPVRLKPRTDAPKSPEGNAVVEEDKGDEMPAQVQREAMAMMQEG